MEHHSITRVGFLGPAGTFTEQALISQTDLGGVTHVPYRAVPDVLDAVQSGEVEAGLVPIENSVEGMVNFTQDALAFDYDLLIQREVVLDIRHCSSLRSEPLSRHPDRGVDRVQPPSVTWLRRTLSNAEVQAANSTADAARTVGERAAAGDKSWAAIAPASTSTLYGLSVLAEDIADHGLNQTRFVLVGRTQYRRHQGTTAPRSWFISAPMSREA
jgi:prephenate dehydratase